MTIGASPGRNEKPSQASSPPNGAAAASAPFAAADAKSADRLEAAGIAERVKGETTVKPRKFGVSKAAARPS